MTPEELKREIAYAGVPETIVSDLDG